MLQMLRLTINLKDKLLNGLQALRNSVRFCYLTTLSLFLINYKTLKLWQLTEYLEFGKMKTM